VQAESDSEADAGAARTILTIDDSRTMRDMLRLALGGAGFTVVQAVDGQDGLKVLPQQPVDVIITDINMPKLDGYGVIRAVRSDPTYDDTPILVLSTEAEQGSKDIANEAGANGWIVKPFDPEGLVKLINTVCE
jgi:two-component system chemotaxis response regulator CheY